MPIDIETTQSPTNKNTDAERHAYRFHAPHLHLQSVFGDDWFALKAEAFARFFGTPSFLITQTVIVAVWILVNVLGLTTFDIYPFILLNLAFSLQAAYAAPLILLAQTRQADRDAAHALADAEHREALHSASEERAALAANQTTLLVEMLRQNTQLTEAQKTWARGGGAGGHGQAFSRRAAANRSCRLVSCSDSPIISVREFVATPRNTVRSASSFELWGQLVTCGRVAVRNAR